MTYSDIESLRLKMSIGVIPDEIKRDIPYFLCAFYFGWDKEIVDSQDYSYIEHMLLLMESFNSMGDKLDSGAGANAGVNKRMLQRGF